MKNLKSSVKNRRQALGKKDAHFAEAEQMYVEEQKGLENIAFDLNLNYKTLHRWKKLGNWDSKRKSYIKSQLSFRERTHNFANKLLDSIEDDFENGDKPAVGRLYTIARILAMITKVQDLPDTAKKQITDDGKTSLTPEDVREIEELLGIKRIPKEE